VLPCALQEPYPDVWEQLDAICRENVDCLQKLLAEQAQLVQRQAEQLKQQALQLQQLQGEWRWLGQNCMVPSDDVPATLPAITAAASHSDVCLYGAHLSSAVQWVETALLACAALPVGVRFALRFCLLACACLLVFKCWQGSWMLGSAGAV
jgi:hypothetical protein